MLAAAIVSHDWGMGVSRVEQQAIISKQEGLISYSGPAGETLVDALIPNEASVFRAYCDTIQAEIKWTPFGVEGRHLD